MAEMPPRPVMPEASKDLGRSPGSRPPRRARARIMGSRAPIRWAEPASARYSRCRETQATMIEARTPKMISPTSTVRE
ncbi:hypothetical protein G6F45_014273 [Rhizopus arrhizus]|nr:hypothetical protein G6F45_014273 [Rhizopus arrhizus]